MPAALLPAAIFVLIAGMLTAVQPPTNAILARASGSVLLAALLSFAIGTAVLLAITLAVQPRIAWAPLRDVPWYAWAGGFYGAAFVAAAGAYGAPRLGVASLITIAVAGQMLAALAIDHYGALGLARTEATPGRVIGVALVLAGVVLVRRF